MIIDHNSPVEIFKKDVTSLTHRLQRILQSIHQYSIKTNKTNRDEEIPGTHIRINAIVLCRHTRLHDRRRNKDSDSGKLTSQCIGRACTPWVAIHKG